MSRKATEGRVSMSLRITSGMFKKLKEEADKNHRSINMQIIHLIAKAGFVVLMFIVTSCSLTSQEIEYSIDPGLAPIVDSFYADAEANGVYPDRGNLIVRYDATANDVGGVSSEIGSQRTIRINQKYQGHPDLKWIVYHELGHAILYRKHKAGHVSIMDPAVWNNGNINKALITELFSI